MGLWQTVDTESEAAVAKGKGQRHAKQALAAFRDARAVRTPTAKPPTAQRVSKASELWWGVLRLGIRTLRRRISCAA